MGLKELRLKYQLSQEKLSIQSTLSVRTIQRIEKENKASIESLNLLSEVFKISKEELKIIIEDSSKEKNTNSKNFFEFLLQNKNTHRFIIINIFLLIINLLTSNTYWFIYPLFIWGFFHFFKSYKSFKLNS